MDFSFEIITALATLTFLEIVLGIDNIIFISIVTNKLPKENQGKTRTIGLLLALVFRIGLLASLSYIIKLTDPLFTVFDHGFSFRDIILSVGGLFLLVKSTLEIHHKIEGDQNEETSSTKKVSMSSVLLQIVVLDIIFSFDSILTAIGLTETLWVMITAVILSMIIMIFAAGSISDFINKHPTLQMLALSFLILIGFMLLVEGFHYEIPKGYIYFAVFFSLLVEMLNMKLRKKVKSNK